MVIYISVPMVSSRVLNFGKTIPLKNLKAHNYGNIHLRTNGVCQGPQIWQDHSLKRISRLIIMVIYISVPMVSARVLNFGKTIPLKNLKAHNYGDIHLRTNGVFQGPQLSQDHSLEESQGS